MNKIGKKNIAFNSPNRGRGRPLGAVNKTTAQAKDMIHRALIELGGQAWLVSVAKSEPKAFLQLVGKLVPLQVGGEVEASLKMVKPQTMTTEEILAKLAELN